MSPIFPFKYNIIYCILENRNKIVNNYVISTFFNYKYQNMAIIIKLVNIKRYSYNIFYITLKYVNTFVLC